MRVHHWGVATKSRDCLTVRESEDPGGRRHWPVVGRASTSLCARLSRWATSSLCGSRRATTCRSAVRPAERVLGRRTGVGSGCATRRRGTGRCCSSGTSVWSGPEPACETHTWTEQRPGVASARQVSSVRAQQWVRDRVAALEGPPASCARTLGVSWSTAWTAFLEPGTPQVDDPERVSETAMVVFDETVMQPAHRRRRRRFVAAVIGVATGQMIDVFEGRDAKDLRLWVSACSPGGDRRCVVSVDRHEG